MQQAKFYKKLDNNEVECFLCSHNCIIKNGRRGVCKARENKNGTLYSLVYGKIAAANIDPIEKKPLFHFLPGSVSFSIATSGCNFQCSFCQNMDISQINHSKQNSGGQGKQTNPEEIVNLALKYKCSSISYTYTEPTVYFEFASDIAAMAQEKGVKNIFVTNGYMSKSCLEALIPWLDGVNIDLKSFNPLFYKKICKADIEPVKNSLKFMKKNGIILEVTTLLIPTINDSEQEIKSIAHFIAKNLGKDTPWHINRFYPTYNLSHIPPTSGKSLYTAKDIGESAGLEYIYIGNFPGNNSENTVCPACKKTLIQRQGSNIIKNLIKTGKCPYCEKKIYGLF
ncbi:MAG: AmmeMemoRadiSam system radical SAM enzyme [Deltaproteobacteria bacterium]|nr:AmmeMemoRadiSam system radical SAM enzyme [Deltaproteobacteria bacterium]